MDDTVWSIGDLAAATGLTVRALHHYDAINLVTPSMRTTAGHRRYTDGDVRRLHRVLALRGFGFTLAEIGSLLDRPDRDVRDLLQHQLDQTTDRIAKATKLKDRIETILARLGDPDADALIQIIEEMTAVERSYTPEQFAELAAQRQAMWERLTEDERAELVRKREEATSRFTAEELEQLHRSRPAINQS
jgi:MerR family transcriptional regulator, thiopeptide resistance regulator